jgi:tRNA pseudouridine55 synthase
MDGVINIFKNKGITSFDVVKKVRKIANEKKVGHTGTLDPEATGVLPVCLGKATKIIDYIMKAEKSYLVTFELGFNTTTYDLVGEITAKNDISHLKETQVLSVIDSFKGGYRQIPPMFSALKKDGVRLYDLARQGIEIEREGRDIIIYDIKDIKISMPKVSMEVSCSKGTYIRSLCFDIGEKLNVGATMVALKRTRTSIFNESESINIEDFTEENISIHLLSIEEVLIDYPRLEATEGYAKLLINGVKLADKRVFIETPEFNKLYRVYDDKNAFLGLGKRDELGFKIEKLLI